MSSSTTPGRVWLSGSVSAKPTCGPKTPGAVWVSVTGYGRHSPGARRPATHPCAGAASGGATIQAGPAISASCETLADVRGTSRQLMRANDVCPDPISSAVAATGVLLGLLARERFGIGQAVYVNMIAANMYANADEAVAYAGKPPPVVRMTSSSARTPAIPQPLPGGGGLGLPGPYYRRRMAAGAGGHESA